MRTIMRFMVEITLTVIFASAILVAMMTALAGVKFDGIDQDTKGMLMVFASILLSVWPVERISAKLFAPRLRVRGVVPPTANPTVNIVVMRGDRQSRVLTVKQDRQGRYLVPVDDEDDR